MGLYDVLYGDSPVSNLHAGTFPIAKGIATVKEGETIAKNAVIATSAEGMMEVTSATLGDVAGIAAEISTDGGVAYYATGEFLESAVIYDESIELDALKTALEKINIYLK